jgi:hypothetical protein
MDLEALTLYLEHCFYLCRYIPKEMKFANEGVSQGIKDANKAYLKKEFNVEWAVNVLLLSP